MSFSMEEPIILPSDLVVPCKADWLFWQRYKGFFFLRVEYF